MEKLLFTGAYGFLGNNVIPLLMEQYKVTTLGMSAMNDIQVNIAKHIPHLEEQYDLVLHAAGKSHVIHETDAEKKLFYDVNLQGTKNLCEAFNALGKFPKSLIFISTVAVYGCESGENITEEHPLNGDSPYADSKKQAEAYLAKWCQENGVKLGIIRPSLIAGPNAPGNLGAMVNGIKTGKYLSIVGGKARKSMLMVQDIATLIPLLSKKGGIYNACDCHQPTFRELEALIASQLGTSIPISIPYWIAKSFALIGDCIGKKAPINSLRLDKITKSLTFSNKKAVSELGWMPLDVLQHYKI